jgi:2,4-dienoyl-CoA reductase (NADPH2)
MSDPAPFAHLLAPGRIGTLELRNRLVLTPMGTNLEASDGTPGPRISRFYEERARGGVGLVVVGVTGIDWPAGVSNPNNMGLSEERFIAPFRELTDRIHAQGAAVAVQLQHAGRVALQDVAAGRARWSPSPLPDSAGDLMQGLTREEIGRVSEPFTRPGSNAAYHEMEEADIEQLKARFAQAAERARQAGFDAVELHAGHGYILSSFLSPSTNRRKDGWGGPLERRARLLLETIRSVRERVGPEFPVWCRLDAVELHKPDGIQPDDARRTAELAVAAGLDAIHVSAYADPRKGIAFTDAPLPHTPGAYVELAAAIKQRVSVPVIAVGRIEPEAGEAILRDGRADFIAMGRRLLADPELPRKLAGESAAAARPCIYSYRCVGNVFLRTHATCTVNPALSRGPEREGPAAASARHVAVAGGGPAGLEAARRLALRGHRVTLLERSERLGGLARAAGAAQPDNAALLRWLESEVRRLGVTLQLGQPATPEAMAALSPDAVVVAIGAGAAPTLPGSQLAHVVDRSALSPDPAPLLARGPRITVIGGDLVGVSLAAWLAQLGARVALLEESDWLAREMPPPRRWRALHALAELEVAVLRGARVHAIERGRVLYRDGEDREQTQAADTVVLARATANDSPLAEELAATGLEVVSIGDCTGPRYFEGCFLDAWQTTRTL